MNDWRPDILGEGFECLDLDLGIDDSPATAPENGDDSAPLVATLVRALPRRVGLWDRLLDRRRPLEGVDVLYVHGWSDYFFQRHLAHFWTDRGARFYALDLRRYGRSLREGQLQGYVENLGDYDAEIALALAAMGRRVASAADAPPVGAAREGSPAVGSPAVRPTDAGQAGPGNTGAGNTGQSARAPGPAHAHDPSTSPLILFGHSTGGLVLSLWADRNRGAADAVILNSPWLELQVSAPLRRALQHVVNLRSRFNPHDLALPQLDLGFYKQAQRMVADPEEQALVNADWRPEHTLPVRSGWLHAILNGHGRIADGLDVGAPVCTLLSARSHFGLAWRDEMLSADTVIEVEGTARAALRLGSSVTVERIDGALHDVFLSETHARADAYARLDRWVTGWSAARV